jgi:phosphoesterase RecJ-like protein
MMLNKSDRQYKLTPPAELIRQLRTGDDFLIASHVNPDGDTLGSASALSMALRQMGKKTVLLDRHPVPDQYCFLPGSDKYHTYETLESEGYKASDFRFLILVDCNDPERIGLIDKQQQKAREDIKSALASGLRSIVIDHHETLSPFGDIKWVVPEAAATGMMIFHLLTALGVSITSDIATNLYAAIVIDTGNFRFENATADVFRTAAELIDCGARPHKIYNEIYESWSDGRFRLYLKVIETLEIRGNIVFSAITQKMFEETGTAADDTENFVSFPRVMKSVAVSVLFRQIGPDEYKVSLRSKYDFNVARIAEQFDGGGHKNAAGCRIKADLETAKNIFFDKIRELEK